MRRWSSCVALAASLVAFVVLLAEPRAAWGEIPRGALPYDDTLQMVLDRIHEHAKDEAWRAPGWKDDKIEAWLEKLVAAVARVPTGRN